MEIKISNRQYPYTRNIVILRPISSNSSLFEERKEEYLVFGEYSETEKWKQLVTSTKTGNTFMKTRVISPESVEDGENVILPDEIQFVNQEDFMIHLFRKVSGPSSLSSECKGFSRETFDEVLNKIDI